MRVLLTADLHIAPHKNSYDRLHDGIKVLEWICETAIKKDCDEVLFCGDLFQDRQRIQVYAYQKTFEVFLDYATRVKWKLLLGNHDLWFAEKWDVSSVRPLSAVQNVEVVSRPCSTEIGGRWFDWLPFVKNPVKAIKDYFPGDHDGRILCAHIAVDGARQGCSSHTSDVSVEFEGDMVKVAPAAFEGWKYVFLGHYHLAQFLDERMQYLGSPYQINFSEVNHEPHVVLLDLDTLTLEYITNDFSPRHLIVKEDDLGKVDMVNNFVQVVGSLTEFDAFEVQRSLANEQVRSLEFRAVRLKEELVDSSEVSERFNLAEGRTAERYVDAVGTNGLERQVLLDTAMEVVDECCEK